MKPALISPHLSEAEFTATQQRDLLGDQERAWLENPIVRANAIRFGRDCFEPVRAIIGACVVSSGYRCPELNWRVGGVPASRHVVGLAADLLPQKMGLVEAMCAIREALSAGRLPLVDRAIFEFGRWIHVQGTLESQRPAHLALMTFGEGYPDFDAADPRVIARRVVG